MAGNATAAPYGAAAPAPPPSPTAGGRGATAAATTGAASLPPPLPSTDDINEIPLHDGFTSEQQEQQRHQQQKFCHPEEQEQQQQQQDFQHHQHHYQEEDYTASHTNNKQEILEEQCIHHVENEEADVDVVLAAVDDVHHSCSGGYAGHVHSGGVTIHDYDAVSGTADSCSNNGNVHNNNNGKKRNNDELLHAAAGEGVRHEGGLAPSPVLVDGGVTNTSMPHNSSVVEVSCSADGEIVDLGDVVLTEDVPGAPMTHHEATYVGEIMAEPPAKRPCLIESNTTESKSSISGGDYYMNKIVLADSSITTSATNTSSKALGPKKVNNEQWDAMFERLVAYKAVHGDCLVPKRYSADPKLGTWVETQRVQYKRLGREVCQVSGVEAIQPNKRLNQERLSKLESIGFAWTAKGTRKPKQAQAPQQEKARPAVAGTIPAAAAAAVDASTKDLTVCPVPGLRHEGEGVTANKSGKPDTLIDGKIEKSCVRSNTIKISPSNMGVQAKTLASSGRSSQCLNTNIGGGAVPTRGAGSQGRLNDVQWEDMYQRLVHYKQKYGDTLVPRKFDEDPRLATWVETQRVLWNRDYREITPTSAATTATVASSKVLASSPEFTQFLPYDLLTGSTSTTGALAEESMELTGSIRDQGEEFHEHIASIPYHPPQHQDQQVSGVIDAAVVGDSLVTATATLVPNVVDGKPPSSSDPKSPSISEQHALKLKEDEGGGGSTSFRMSAASQQSKRLTRERKEKLDALGFVWSLRNKRIDDHWDEMFRQLVEYKGKHGDCLVPSRYEENLKLGKWVETQRYEYTKLQRIATDVDTPTVKVKTDDIVTSHPGSKPRATNPRLTDERLRRLESIGFEWKVKHKMKRYYDKQWDLMFERLLKFKEANGHCMVPKRYPPEMKLGTWVHTQRIQYRKMLAGVKGTGDPPSDSGTELDPDLGKNDEEVPYRLTEERRKRLEEIGFIWSARESEKAESGRITRNSYDDQWDAMFIRLEEFKKQNGHCLVPKRHKEDPKLGTWVDTQRVQYKKMKKKLESLGKSWDGPELADDDPDLDGSGIAKPVVGRLTNERIRRLEALGFVWSLRDDWQKHYDELKEYKREHGNCNVPARFVKNRRLGIWVSAQRQQYKLMQGADDSKRRSAPLTQERINLLNEIGFTWTIRSRDSLVDSWNQRLDELKVYKEQYGNCLVPSRFPPNPELGIWVGSQRTQYRMFMRAKEEGRPLGGNAVMNEERIAHLEEIGMVWTLRGGDAKKEIDPIDAAAIEQEAMQVADELALGDELGDEAGAALATGGDAMTFQI